MEYKMNHIQGTRNIVENTLKVETVGVNAQTQSMQYSEAGTNTNLCSNRYAQTQPILTQSTNTPSQNHISNLNEKCQCEDNEIEDMGLQYQSEFSRSLQQSEVIPKYYTQQPVTNYNSLTEKPNISQTESSTIYHIPQESISHTQPPALQYTHTQTDRQTH